MKIFQFFFIVLIISCNTNSDELEAENKALQEKLNDIEFGIPNLMKTGRVCLESKDLDCALSSFHTLIEKHPTAIEVVECKKLIAVIEEEKLWQSAINNNDIRIIENYINSYPKGKYIAESKTLKETVKKNNLESAYQNAESSNSSQAWKSFLEDYPDDPKAKAIKRKIIQLEVDEIMGDKKTGQMPQFDQRSSGSSTSKVTISNNTGCLLTVRYSGSDVQSIDIPEDGTRSVHLSSGEYRIAASACGANYAGTESLSGNYSSSFYIRSSRL